MDCSAETAQPTGRAAVSATALSTGPATPVSPAVSAAPPPSTFDSNKVTTAAQYDPMQLDNAANDASSTRQQGDRVDEAFSLSSSRSANRVVGPFTLSPGKADAASHSDTDEAAPSTSRYKRPLGADSSPVKDAADDAAHGSGDAANDSAVEPPKKKARKSAGPKAVTQYCHQDHQAHDITKVSFLRCTAQKVAGKPKPGSTEVPTRPCSLSYCARCLSSRYDEDAGAVTASGADATWTCPSCRGECNCSSCRKRAGLDTAGPLKELGVDPSSAVGPVTGGRRAAAAARTKMSSGFTASGKVAAMSLTLEDGSTSSTLLPGSKKSKGKKPVKAKGITGPSLDGSLSDSSLSELTDSDEDKPSRKQTAKGKSKSADGSPAPLGPTGKRVMPPRPPRDLPAPPRSHVLSSVWAPSPALPCAESMRARLHLREWFLRFLPCLPPIDPNPPTSSSSKSSSSRTTTKPKTLSPHLVRVLSALSDDVLWLWRDRDSAAEAVQLRLLQALVELLVGEKAYTGVIHKLQREDLDDLRVELRTALSGVQRQREVFDRPWRTAQRVAEGGMGAYWVEEGPKWQKAAVEKRQRAEAQRKAKSGGGGGGGGAGRGGSVSGSAADGDESDLSSIASSDDDEDRGGGGDEVDQLASDYEEPPPKLDKAGRRMKGERDMPGEERLAVLCALIELASGTEAVRNEIAQGVDSQYTEMIALRRKRFEQRKALPAEKARLEESKPEKPPGNSISAKVKEWKDECDAIDDKIKQAGEDAIKSAWRLQHEFFLAGTKHRIRFASLGTDAHGTEYYSPAPPPPQLLQSPAGASTSGFPLDRKPSDDGARDYPLSWCIIGHGRRPTAADDGAEAFKVEAEDERRDGDDDEAKEWFVVRGVDDLDALAEWVDLSARHAEHGLRLAQFQLEHPKTKTNGVVRPAPTQAEMAAYERAAARADDNLPDALRQFADAIKWRRELAQREKDGGADGVMAERTRAHRG